jgi:hypothetical protein
MSITEPTKYRDELVTCSRHDIAEKLLIWHVYQLFATGDFFLLVHPFPPQIKMSAAEY